jgi:hypothetical protein
MRPLMVLSGLADGADLCPVSGEERTSRFHDVMSGFDFRQNEDTAVAKDEEPFEALTAIAEQTAKQITEQTTGA